MYATYHPKYPPQPLVPGSYHRAVSFRPRTVSRLAAMAGSLAMESLVRPGVELLTSETVPTLTPLNLAIRNGTAPPVKLPEYAGPLPTTYSADAPGPLYATYTDARGTIPTEHQVIVEALLEYLATGRSGKDLLYDLQTEAIELPNTDRERVISEARPIVEAAEADVKRVVAATGLAPQDVAGKLQVYGANGFGKGVSQMLTGAGTPAERPATAATAATVGALGLGLLLALLA